MAVYPTLALANDQIRRIHAFAKAVGFKTEAIDALRRDDLVRVYGRSRLRSMLGELDVLVTNPAFLLNEVKKNVTAARNKLLDKFLSGLDLVVLDELDFYGPREIALLLSMLKLLREILARDFRVAVLTATLGNPEELAAYLERLTGRETAVILGEPFRVENRVYVVLGKNLRAIWSDLRQHRRLLENSGKVGSDVLRALDDYSEFRKNYVHFQSTTLPYQVWISTNITVLKSIRTFHATNMPNTLQKKLHTNLFTFNEITTFLPKNEHNVFHNAVIQSHLNYCVNS